MPCRRVQGWRKADSGPFLRSRSASRAARRAEGIGEFRKAAEYWERLSEHDPLNTRHTSSLMKALASVGDPGNAIRVGEDHIGLLRAELEADAPSQLVAPLQTLKSGRSAAP